MAISFFHLTICYNTFFTILPVSIEISCTKKCLCEFIVIMLFNLVNK